MIDSQIKELENKYDTNVSTGLSSDEVRKRIDVYGLNELVGKKNRSIFLKFLDQFKDSMVIILIVAAIISFIVALNGHERSEFLEPVIIIGIVILNAVLGTIQESKAEKALDALKTLSAPHAKAIRNGKTEIVEVKDIVPGDIIIFESGDFIPADSRLVESMSLKCEESALTGESVPVEKDQNSNIDETAPLGDRVNMVFSGCSVSYGRGRAIVVETGMNTQMGKIATLLESSENSETPLQKKLAQLGKYLGLIALIICVIIFVIGIYSGLSLINIFMISVSLAVSAIPEGLPTIVTIVLAIGVQKMAKKNAIVRQLTAVETLGSASIICSDKTGTLTQNKMTVISAWVEGEPEEITDNVSEKIKELLKYGALSSDASVDITDGIETSVGDPTETSIISAALKNNITKENLAKEYPRIGEIPFDSERKLMSTIVLINGKPMVITKGAFDVIESRCVNKNFDSAIKVNNDMANKALRVIAVAYKHLEKMPEIIDSSTIENGLTFLGLIGMIDPPREEAKEAVSVCIKAGIRPIMITGDHVITARAIASELGILKEGDESITGIELSKMNDDEFMSKIHNYSVYARVSPEDKIRIVRAWQNIGEIVSMTGDGVNDAPALKAADIGCAMGITGTDVSKGAADMILTDDNFATIVTAVREGRSIYENIKKAIQFLLGTNVGEIFTVLIAMIFWQRTPLLAMHLLWLNLVTDGLPALALGMEVAEDSIMSQKPKPKGESLFANGLGVRILLQGLMFAVLTLIGYYIGFKDLGGENYGQTMAFLVLSMSQIFHALNVRTTKSIFVSPLTKNKYMIYAIVVSFVLIALIVFIPPIALVFKVSKLPMNYYLISLGLAIVPIIVIEIEKLIRNISSKA